MGGGCITRREIQGAGGASAASGDRKPQLSIGLRLAHVQDGTGGQGERIGREGRGVRGWQHQAAAPEGEAANGRHCALDAEGSGAGIQAEALGLVAVAAGNHHIVGHGEPGTLEALAVGHQGCGGGVGGGGVGRCWTAVAQVEGTGRGDEKSGRIGRCGGCGRGRGLEIAREVGGRASGGGDADAVGLDAVEGNSVIEAEIGGEASGYAGSYRLSDIDGLADQTRGQTGNRRNNSYIFLVEEWLPFINGCNNGSGGIVVVSPLITEVKDNRCPIVLIIIESFLELASWPPHWAGLGEIPRGTVADVSEGAKPTIKTEIIFFVDRCAAAAAIIGFTRLPQACVVTIVKVGYNDFGNTREARGGRQIIP